jgi:hypothetical protein
VATPAAYFDPGHGHVVIARRAPLDLDGRRDAELWVTLWLCPVRRQLSAVLEDERPIDPGRQPLAGRLEEL